MRPEFSTEPQDPAAYTTRMDRSYARMAALYDRAVRRFPIWTRWTGAVLPYIEGPNVLEISVGTGELFSRYAGSYHSYGLDLNTTLLRIAAGKLKQSAVQAHLQQADVYHLPFRAGAFQTVVNTMAFSGYPRGLPALAEMHRVLVPGGIVLMVDVGFPQNRNLIGMAFAKLWQAAGDILRDLPPLFRQAGYSFDRQEIGGFGSVQLIRARKSH